MNDARSDCAVASPAWSPSGGDRLLRRIGAEFLEMPGLSLTVAQAARLFGVAEGDCARALDRLGEQGLLRFGRHGHWRLRSR